MNTILASGRIRIIDCLSDTFSGDIRTDLLEGLTAAQKHIPSKYFYDSRGSQLFDLICSLPEYYQTRTELSILQAASSSIMANFRNCYLVELGSGSNLKIRTLLDAAACHHELCYMPIDVSETVLYKASMELLDIYPSLNVLGMIADFTRHTGRFPADRNKLFVFFGSTIGNFEDLKRSRLLRSISGLMGPSDRFIVGIDMIKNKSVIENAYNDAMGITAEFNKNILNVVNRELGADFNPDHFDHLAFFDEKKERVEMHLKANRRVSVDVGNLALSVHFEKDETIHTEICTKFSGQSAERMASEAGLRIERWFSDSKGWFSLIELARTI